MKQVNASTRVDDSIYNRNAESTRKLMKKYAFCVSCVMFNECYETHTEQSMFH